MSFIDEFDIFSTIKETENGGLAYSTTGAALIDFFASIGGLRNREEKDIVSLYLAARQEDKELADKVILYTRDIRNGLGERRIGRILLRELAKIDPQKVIRNFDLFVELGRFDDLYSLEGTPAEKEMWKFLKATLEKDLKAYCLQKPISLAAKWMKSLNTSSKESRRLAKKFCSINVMSEKKYRKILTTLRKYLDVTEVKMSSNKWENIEYSKVPSVAMNKYKQAFFRHSSEKFSEYIDNVKNGKEKINSSVLFPQDIIKNLWANRKFETSVDKDVSEMQWKSLPNYFKEGHNVVCCADVSGSMTGSPMWASIGLAIYCAQHNMGVYKNHFLTFTDSPRFFNIEGYKTLKSIICEVEKHVGYNTNLNGMLESIFKMSVKAQESPEALLIVSDNEIDYFLEDSSRCSDIVELWTTRFMKENLPMPKIIFWNVSSRHNTYLACCNNPYVNYISGLSASNFSELGFLIDYTPEEAMCKILEKYKFN